MDSVTRATSRRTRRGLGGFLPVLVRIGADEQPDRGVVAPGEVAHDPGHLVRICGLLPGGGADHGRELSHGLLVGLADLGDRHRRAGPVGAHRTGFDHGDPDAQRCDLLGEPGGESDDGPLRALIGAQARRCEAAGERGDLEDVPGSPLAQSGQHGFGHVDDAEEVGVDLSAEVFEGDVFDGGDIGVAGVVDHDVVAPERIEALLHRAVDLLGVGDVECDRPHVLP